MSCLLYYVLSAIYFTIDITLMHGLSVEQVKTVENNENSNM